MCGIAGLLQRDVRRPADGPALDAMLRALRHRGPDDEGTLLDGPLALGMRRLSIIDLEGGHQPIANEDETVWTVFNGEIYNYLELRDELAARGHVFRTDTDTEVLVHGWEAWGAGLWPRLNGMFAAAIWETRDRRLTIARDRVGIKPLYYCLEPDRLAFASELKALRAAGCRAELDPVALGQYLACGWVPTPRTIYRGARKLEPGCWLRADAAGIATGRFWEFRFTPDPPGRSPESYVDELDGLLGEVVARQMRSSVEVGALLSGGLDSSLVTSAMRPHAPAPPRTFCLGFDVASYDERDVAGRIAGALGTRHHQARLGAEAITEYPRLCAHFDEPFFDYSMLPTYAVSRLAREQVKVVLTGDGGDELFGGYPTHLVHRAARLWRLLPRGARAGLAAGIERLPTSHDRLSADYLLKQFVRWADADPRRAHTGWKELLDESRRRAVLVDGLADAADDATCFEPFAQCFAAVRDQPLVNQLLYCDLRTFLLDDCLQKVDRMSMAASLEARVPLLDNAMLDFAARLPVGIKLPGWQTKPVLRALAARRLPATITRLRKRGFTPPLPAWLHGPRRDWLREMLNPAEVAACGLLNPAAVTRLVDEHLSGRVDWNRPLFALISLVVQQRG